MQKIRLAFNKSLQLAADGLQASSNITAIKDSLSSWKDWYDEEWVEYEEFDRYGISYYYPKNPSKNTTNDEYPFTNLTETCLRAELERTSLNDSDEEVVIEVIKIKARWSFLSDDIEEIDDTFELVDIF